ncbi:hypothetical protein P4S73_09840 [Paraglaciecola sp. Hal342]
MSKSLLHPRHWASWLAVLILRIIALLPFKVKMLAGGAFGRFGFRFLSAVVILPLPTLRCVFHRRAPLNKPS